MKLITHFQPAMKLAISLLLRFFIILGLFILTRNLFYLINFKFFNQLTFTELLKINLAGLRFDISAIAAFNALFAFLYLLPVPLIHQTKSGKKVLVFLFVFVNSILLLFNCIDIIYYQFTLKRSTSDFLAFAFQGKDVLNFIPLYLYDYWYMTLIWLLMVWILYVIYKKIPYPSNWISYSKTGILRNAVLILIFAGLIVLGIRGGMQLKPLRPIKAAEVAGPKYASLVSNTPFTLMKTVDKHVLKVPGYYTEEQLKRLRYTPLKDFHPTGVFNPLNVVIIIMESFSKEYMGKPYGTEGATPFLDSLAGEGLFFNNAFANGTRSMEGLPAIISSMPSLMNDPYIKSVYAGNKFSSMALLLKEKGYHTSFFHGGAIGTMGFDAYCKIAGIDHYFGSEDYPNASHHDDAWGIFDEPFFQFYAQQLDQIDKPFFSVFFSLTSHHPYPIPREYEDVFSDGRHPIIKTIRYSDFSLRRFFETVKNMPWYPNTLFVITADHGAPALSDYYNTRPGGYAIPILYFKPFDASLNGLSSTITQQIDIMPTVLEYLRYDQPFFSFGVNTLGSSSGPHFAINYLDGIYQYISESYVLHFDGSKSIALFQQSDSLMQNNLIENKKRIVQQLTTQCKAVIEWYHWSLISDALTYEGHEGNTRR